MGVGVAIPVTVVTLGPSNLLAIMKSINSHRDRGGRRRHPCNCRHLTFLAIMKSMNSHRDRGGRHRQTVTGTVGVGVAIPVTVVTSGPLNLVAIMKSTNSHLDRGGRRRHPCNCHHFWTLESSCNYEKYRGGRRRHPCDCHHFLTLVVESWDRL